MKYKVSFHTLIDFQLFIYLFTFFIYLNFILLDSLSNFQNIFSDSFVSRLLHVPRYSPVYTVSCNNIYLFYKTLICTVLIIILDPRALFPSDRAGGEKSLPSLPPSPCAKVRSPGNEDVLIVFKFSLT